MIYAAGVFTVLVSLLHEGGQFVTCPQSVIWTLRDTVGFPGPRCWVSAGDSLLGWCVWCILPLKEHSSTRHAGRERGRAGLPLDPRPLAVSISPKVVKAINHPPHPPTSHGETTDLKTKNKKTFRLYFQCFSSLVETFNWVLLGWSPVIFRCVHGDPVAGGH